MNRIDNPEIAQLSKVPQNIWDVKEKGKAAVDVTLSIFSKLSTGAKEWAKWASEVAKAKIDAIGAQAKEAAAQVAKAGKDTVYIYIGGVLTVVWAAAYWVIKWAEGAKKLHTGAVNATSQAMTATAEGIVVAQDAALGAGKIVAKASVNTYNRAVNATTDGMVLTAQTAKATRDGALKVHAWAVEATSLVMENTVNTAVDGKNAVVNVAVNTTDTVVGTAVGLGNAAAKVGAMVWAEIDAGVQQQRTPPANANAI